MRNPKTLLLPALLAAMLPAAAFAAEHEILVGQDGNNFSPNILTITAGDSVTFRQVAGFHNVASIPGAVTSFRCGPNGCDGVGTGNGDPGGGTWQQTVVFENSGTANYLCDVHGASMSGSIIVNPVPVTLQSFDID
jgi:plastocyanin